jgi:hypothetical protein
MYKGRRYRENFDTILGSKGVFSLLKSSKTIRARREKKSSRCWNAKRQHLHPSIMRIVKTYDKTKAWGYISCPPF